MFELISFYYFSDEPILTEWGPWSGCTVTCGNGTDLRERECNPGGPCPDCTGDDCDCGEDLEEIVDCYTPLSEYKFGQFVMIIKERCLHR